MEANDLVTADQRAAGPLRALTYDRPPPAGSHASPHAFVCSDGRTYWIKRSAQHGLIAELVAGRLGARIGAAPNAHPVEVPEHALPTDGTANHLLGLGVGILDEPNMENFRHITERAPDGNLDPSRLNASGVARVIVFQTWIGAEDTQILVDLRTGRLLSLDHGALTAFGSPGSTPTVVVAPGIPGAIGRDAQMALPVVSEIEALSDEQVLAAVAGCPDGPEWQADVQRRLTIVNSLGLRRDRLREVVSTWLS